MAVLGVFSDYNNVYVIHQSRQHRRLGHLTVRVPKFYFLAYSTTHHATNSLLKCSIIHRGGVQDAASY